MLNQYSTTYRDSVSQIIVINKAGTILDNDTTIFNAINGTHISVLHPFFETITALLTNDNTTHKFNCVNLNINSRNYIVDLSLKTFKEDDNSVLILSDLTKQYNAYQKVAQLRNESEIQSEILAHKNELLKKKEVFKNNFIANFSHEIRMPINTISGSTILLESSNLSQSQLYNLKVIQSTNEKLKYMINDILDLSKIETGFLSILENEINLIDELQTIIDIYAKKCEYKGLTLETEIDRKCPKYVISDKFRLAQVSGNLIGNAIKFTNSGSVSLKVKVISKTKKIAKLEFTVEDTGIGIEKDKIDFIFDSFYQINNKQANKGAGLGLAIVKRLAEALGGTINVTSELDKGSIFTVVLPFKIAQNQVKDSISLQSKTKKTYDYRVLVGETIKKDQIAISKLLNNSGIYDCVIVDNGDDVINQLHKSKFDIVLLNLRLPKMDGFDIARYIRFSEFIQFSEIPIIAMTDRPNKKEEANCLEKQMNGYIGKPFTDTTVLDVIKNSIQKKRTE
jgi:signal transduction histidine kinase/CheY-like chemotaxis protein